MGIGGVEDYHSRASTQVGNRVAQVRHDGAANAARDTGFDYAATRERGCRDVVNETRGRGVAAVGPDHNRSVVDQIAGDGGVAVVVEREGRPGSDRGTVEGRMDRMDLSTADAGEVATEDL